MTVKILDPNSDSDLREAARIIRNGGVIAHPTDTVMGLACDASNSSATRHLFKIKRREFSYPVITACRDLERAAKLGAINERALKLLRHFAERPLTVIVPAASDHGNDLVIKNGERALRVPPDPFFQKLLCECGRDLCTTSANFSGEETARDHFEVEALMGAQLDAIIAGASTLRPPSTMVRITGDKWEMVRMGSIDEAEIAAVW